MSDSIFDGRRCDNCGAHDVPLVPIAGVKHDDAYCLACELAHLASASGAALAALDGLEGQLNGMLQHVHPDDVRAVVEQCIAANTRPGVPLTQRELGDREHRNYLARESRGPVDAAIAELERQFSAGGGGSAA